jgi:hypothetical protein
VCGLYAVENSQHRTTHTQHRHAATAQSSHNQVHHYLFLNFHFSKEQCVLLEDDLIIET